jgi:hypothetical protein
MDGSGGIAGATAGSAGMVRCSSAGGGGTSTGAGRRARRRATGPESPRPSSDSADATTAGTAGAGVGVGAGAGAGAGAGTADGSVTTTGGGSGTVPVTVCCATSIGSFAGSVTSNIGSADGRALDSTGRAAATAAGCDSNARRASPREIGSTVAVGRDVPAEGAGVSGGGATGCEVEHAPSSAAAMQAGRNEVVSRFIEFSLRS